MSYVSRMYARLLLPSLLPLAAAGLIATVAYTLSQLPTRLGGAPLWPGVPDTLIDAGAAASVLVYVFQLVRLVRWHRGRDATCYVCSCLLGRERIGRRGLYRRCLGCGQSHTA